MAPQNTNRTRRIVGAVAATGVAAAIGAGVALSGGVAYASEAFDYPDLNRLMITNLSDELKLPHIEVHNAYERIVMEPEIKPDRNDMISGLAGQLDVSDSQMETAFDAAWETTLTQLDEIAYDRFENWTGGLVQNEELTEAQWGEALDWFNNRPGNDLAPMTLIAAYSTQRSMFDEDLDALVEMDLINQQEADDLLYWHTDRPDFLPLHSSMANSVPTGPADGGE